MSLQLFAALRSIQLYTTKRSTSCHVVPLILCCCHSSTARRGIGHPLKKDAMVLFFCTTVHMICITQRGIVHYGYDVVTDTKTYFLFWKSMAEHLNTSIPPQTTESILLFCQICNSDMMVQLYSRWYPAWNLTQHLRLSVQARN